MKHLFTNNVVISVKDKCFTYQSFSRAVNGLLRGLLLFFFFLLRMWKYFLRCYTNRKDRKNCLLILPLFPRRMPLEVLGHVSIHILLFLHSSVWFYFFSFYIFLGILRLLFEFFPCWPWTFLLTTLNFSDNLNFPPILRL